MCVSCVHCINKCFSCAAPEVDDYLELTAVVSMVINMSMSLTCTRDGSSNITVTGEASRDVYEMIAEGATYQKILQVQPLSLAATVCFTLFDDVYAARECTEVTVENVNDPPVVTVSASLIQYNESSRQPVAIFTSLTIYDPDPESNSIYRAFVEFDPEVDPNDTLDLASNIPGASHLNITVETQSILIKGQANSSVYEAVLTTTTFANLDRELDLSNRTLTLVVSDGKANSSPAKVTVQILPFDDPPVCFFGLSEVRRYTCDRYVTTIVTFSNTQSECITLILLFCFGNARHQSFHFTFYCNIRTCCLSTI